MAAWFEDEGLVKDAPIVATQENAGNPHYLPGLASARRIGADQLLMLDLWGKLPQPGAVFADITWMGFTGRQIPDEVTRAFAAIREARDVAVTTIETAVGGGREI